MQWTEEYRILVGVILSTILLLFLAGIIIYSIYRYNRKQDDNLIEKENLRKLYKQEVKNAKIETRELVNSNISEILHNQVGQVLTLAKVQLNLVSNTGNDHFTSKITQSKKLISEAITDIRDISHMLNNHYVESSSFSDLIEKICVPIEQSGLYIIKRDINPQCEDFTSSDDKVILFRITQEIFQNIMKHANAKNIYISLYNLDHNAVYSIKDDGIGISDEQSTGIGLNTIHKRVAMIGGLVEINSILNHGTEITISIPKTRNKS